MLKNPKIIVLLILIAMFTRAYAVDLGVMVVYNTEFSRINNPNLFIQNQLNYVNQVSVNSNMKTRYFLVHHQELNLYKSTQVTESLRNLLLVSPELLRLRNQYRPDLVVYLTKSSATLCGIAYFPYFTDLDNIGGVTVYSSPKEMANFGVSVVGWDCSVDVFAHEIGHNLGGGHGPVKSAVHYGKPFSFSQGHGVKDVFRTVMAYSDVFGTAPRIALHSNPSVTFNTMLTGTSSRNNAGYMDLIAEKHVQHYSSCFPASFVESVDNPAQKVFACGGICTKYVRNDSGYLECSEYLP